MISVPVLGVPGISVPTGVAYGLPIGVQFIGAWFAENVILDAAQAVEDRARMRAFLEHRTAKITR